MRIKVMSTVFDKEVEHRWWPCDTSDGFVPRSASGEGLGEW